MKKTHPQQSRPPADRMGAVVLSRYSVGDSDYIVTFLTREQGLVSALAKNARQSIRRFGGNLLSPGMAAWYYLRQRPNSNLAFVERGEINPAAPNLPMDPICRALVAWALELVRAFEAHHNPAEPTFNLLLRHFGALAAASDFAAPSLAARRLSFGFTKCYLQIAGFGVGAENCCICGKKDSESWYAEPSFDGLICRQCERFLDRRLHNIPNSLREALLTTATHRSSPQLDEETLNIAENYFQHRASVQAGRAFKSPKVLRQLLENNPSDASNARRESMNSPMNSPMNAPMNTPISASINAPINASINASSVQQNTPNSNDDRIRPGSEGV
ncbi:MAG: DNA repair protein RecO [Deltaproteobacteria bacterium]|jgi:DNA repair protein RecO (recombination protein O)|nr:DNA repair protein RecO [Deltaproteobacteria bacterium]